MRDAKQRAVAGFPPSPPFDRAGWSCMPRRLCVASVHRRGLIRWGGGSGWWTRTLLRSVRSLVCFPISGISTRVSNCRSLAGPAPSSLPKMSQLWPGAQAARCRRHCSLQADVSDLLHRFHEATQRPGRRCPAAARTSDPNERPYVTAYAQEQAERWPASDWFGAPTQHDDMDTRRSM